jgi:phosphodiesterase/alkaline phosphatase D-like protein
MSKTDDDFYPERSARRRVLGAMVGAVGAAPLALGLASNAAASNGGRSRLALRPAAFDGVNGSVLIGLWGHEALELYVGWSNGSNALDQKSAALRLTAQNDFVGTVALNGLPSGATIRYAAFVGANRISEIGEFRAPFSADAATPNFSLAFSGDTEERHRPFRIFDVMAAQNPDVFVHLGDTVYADIPKRDFEPTLRHYRRKHFAIRSDEALQRFAARTVTYATWDDHEIENDTHGGHPAIGVAGQAFREYWPSQSVSDRGMYRHVSLGKDVDLFMLDTRAFRSIQSAENDDQKTMLGAAQMAWFTDAYEKSKARFRLVASSVPMHGSSKDAWGNYSSERDRLFTMFRRAFRDSNAHTIVLSADYHFAREWPRNEKSGIYEFMAGPLATFLTFSRDNAAKARNSRGEHFVYGDSENFGSLRYNAVSKTMSVAYFNHGGRQLHARNIG